MCHVGADGAVKQRASAPTPSPRTLDTGTRSQARIALPAGTTSSASSSWLQVQGTPEHAFDGNTAWAWNAGTYPVQWIEVNFGSPLPFSKIRGWSLGLNGTTNHRDAGRRPA